MEFEPNQVKFLIAILQVCAAEPQPGYLTVSNVADRPLQALIADAKLHSPGLYEDTGGTDESFHTATEPIRTLCTDLWKIFYMYTQVIQPAGVFIRNLLNDEGHNILSLNLRQADNFKLALKVFNEYLQFLGGEQACDPARFQAILLIYYIIIQPPADADVRAARLNLISTSQNDN